uniref:p53 DNA-binding domain-containing protein n=1 Tax=Anopheles farauti TaxID=69004 RepID=A0A182Q706_9DIPT
MSSPLGPVHEDDDITIADEDMFVNASQLSLINSEVLANNLLTLVDQVNDDTVILPALTQDSLTEIKFSLPSSLNPSGKYPSVEEFCHEEIACTVVPSSNQGAGFVYSEKLQKLFLKTESICSFDVKCEIPNTLPTRWYVRVMLVSLAPELQHEPIMRCYNHLAKDSGPEFMRNHVVRCKNELHEYVGHENGPFYEDRFAVRVPLDLDVPYVKLTLQFVCQNTCFSLGQRRTGLVFTLESEEGHIWARRTVPVKICINYRRDMLNEETALQKSSVNLSSLASLSQGNNRIKPTKVGRPRKRTYASVGKYDQKKIRSASIKTPLSLEPCAVHFEMPSIRMAKRVLDNAIGMISAQVLRFEDQDTKAKLMEFINNIRLQRDTLMVNNSQCSVDSELF